MPLFFFFLNSNSLALLTSENRNTGSWCLGRWCLNFISHSIEQRPLGERASSRSQDDINKMSLDHLQQENDPRGLEMWQGHGGLDKGPSLAEGRLFDTKEMAAM